MITKHGIITIEDESICLKDMNFKEVDTIPEILNDVREHINSVIDEAITDFNKYLPLRSISGENLNWQFKDGKRIK